MNNDIQLSKKIEAFLFYRGEPVSLSELAKTFKVTPDEVTGAIEELQTALQDRALAVVIAADTYTLATASGMSDLIANIRKEELSRELSKASLDTLSIILYSDSPTRSDIDFVRGVNSSFILRNLLMRGLIERREHETDSRKIVYVPSTDLLMHLGATSREALPEFGAIRDTIKKILDGKEAAISEDHA